MTRTITATALALLLPAFQAQAAAENGAFAVDGVGRATCADFNTAVEDRDVQLINAFGSWTSGFLSATNALAPQTFDLTPWQSEGLIMSQMQNFCAQNAEVAYVDGVGRLVQALDPTKLTAEAEQTTFDAGEDELQIYAPVLDGIRSALAAQGYSVGEGDAGLSEALTAFQSANDLDETGSPDQRTLAALFLR